MSCRYYFGVLLCHQCLKALLSNPSVLRCICHFNGLWQGSQEPLYVLGKIIWIFLSTAFHYTYIPSLSVPPPRPFSHHPRHKAEWLGLTRETVATVGPADHSSMLTMDTDPLLVVGMAVSIQHPLGKINQKPGLQSIKQQQRLPAFPQQQRMDGPLATPYSSKIFS